MDVTSDDGHYRKKRYKGDTLMAMDSGCDVNSNTSTISDKIGNNNSKYNSESDQDSDYSLVFTNNKNLNIDNDYNIGPEETWSFLYRYFTISIVINEILRKPNLVFIKATLLYTKGEDNYPRI